VAVKKLDAAVFTGLTVVVLAAALDLTGKWLGLRDRRGEGTECQLEDDCWEHSRDEDDEP
jgi:hypothetical protein